MKVLRVRYMLLIEKVYRRNDQDTDLI